MLSRALTVGTGGEVFRPRSKLGANLGGEKRRGVGGERDVARLLLSWILAILRSTAVFTLSFQDARQLFQSSGLEKNKYLLKPFKQVKVKFIYVS